ncbi:beta-L-arabinofuranosidase domain-containing protein [Sphingomonas nostoxanthinifaciens]|uniref:beta-L-arabinofuranosidase domain-containing protein n=1 Tax=Sphingomonas nostoxanthinifaciens TaxID=2872652 RepID=UPI001CC2044E|nr:beta-L-arabinofuranosidase domain-containing protein [Sphingomonas nostoxanthinifaciens]UAK23495.1 glycoside hydrolase family 127 protein [Sphingomonas nostoxanthinifaciens]
MVDRRTFLAGVGAFAAAGGVARGAAPAGVRAKPLDEVDYADVVLLDGRARRQAEATLNALMAMDEAALLRPFRQGAGQTVAAHQFGGWYDWSPSFAPSANMTGFIPGHSFGQYVSALARAYAVTGDAAAKAKADRLVAAFAPTITPDFYKNYPIPAYTYDKIVIGLLDAHRFAGNAQALPLIGRATDAVLPYLPGRAVDRAESEKSPKPNMAFGWDETYTLPENLYLVAAAGGGDRYRAMARQYLLDRTYFEPLAAGRNVLAGRHAYSHVNAMASAMQSYLVDGGVTHFLAARNGMDFVVQQSFATGGWGPNEAFVEADSPGLGHSLETTHRSFEAPCGCYGHFKVARYLMRATGDSRHGDAVERLFYNAALGLLPLQPNGAAFYYADYNELGAKTYYEYACPCCSGSIGQLTADYGKTAYLRDDEGLYVNLYTPSKATWRRRGEPALVLTQTGSYPLTDDVAMSVAAPRPVTMALRLRIPAWAGPATRVSVNGRAVAGVTPGRFLTIAREWRAGDTIALAIDRPLYTKAVDAHAADHVALMQGPLAMFGTGDRHALLTRAELASLRQDAPGGTDWSLQGGTGRQSFKPYFAIHPGEVTRLYQRVADPVRA